MRLTSCVEQFFDLYHFRIKGSSHRTIKAYREALTLFLPFAAKYYSIKVASLSINHLSLDVILTFLDYLESDRANTANTRNQRLAVIKSLAKMIRKIHDAKISMPDLYIWHLFIKEIANGKYDFAIIDLHRMRINTSAASEPIRNLAALDYSMLDEFFDDHSKEVFLQAYLGEDMAARAITIAAKIRKRSDVLKARRRKPSY